MIRTTLAVLLLSTLGPLAACGDDGDSGDSTGGMRAVVAAGPFTSEIGTLAAIDMASTEATLNVAPATAIGGDPVVRKIGNELLVVNRAVGNNVTILKASDFSLVEQLATGAGSNPQDVAAVGNKLYVANYEGKGLTVLTRGGTTPTEIDLSADDPDGTPNCSSVYAVGTKVYVACQILDDANMFAIRGTSKVYVVDTANDSISATLDLSTPNPFGLFEQVPAGGSNAGSLLIGTVSFVDGSGCVERITTGGTPAAAGCLINNTALNGNALRIAFGENMMYLLVSAADFSGGAVRTAPVGSATLDAAPFSIAGQPLGDMASCPDGRVVVTEQPPFGAPATAPYGVRIYEDTGSEFTTAPIDIGMKPGSQHGIFCY